MANDDKNEKKVLCRVCLTEHAADADCPDAADDNERRRRVARVKIWDEEIEREERERINKESKAAKPRKTNRFGL